MVTVCDYRNTLYNNAYCLVELLLVWQLLGRQCVIIGKGLVTGQGEISVGKDRDCSLNYSDIL